MLQSPSASLLFSHGFRLCVDYALISFSFVIFPHGAPILRRISADVLLFFRFSHIVPRLCVGYAPISLVFAAFLKCWCRFVRRLCADVLRFATFLVWCSDSASIVR